MPRFHDLNASFNTGELSPRLSARLDFTKYKSGVETMENLLALPEGGAMRRSGSRYVAATKNGATEQARLKKFEFSTTQAYIIEAGKEYMRFYRNQGQITIPNTDAAVTNGAFGSNISGWTDSSNGTGAIAHDATNLDMELQAAGSGNEAIAEQSISVTTTSVEHVIKFRVLGVAGDAVTVRVGSASGGSQFLADFSAKVGWHAISFTPTASPMYLQFENGLNKTLSIDDVSLIDNAPVEVGTPYAEADLFQVEGPQSADILYQFHASYAPHKLERRGHTTWSFVEVGWIDGPYFDLNTESTTMTPAAASGLGINVTASAVTGINDGNGFVSTDVGRLIRIDNPASGIEWGYGVISSVTSTTVAVVDIKRDFATTNADTRWKLGAWSETTGRPSASSFFEGRLWMGNTTDQPTTFWASQSDDFENMTPDSDPTNEPDTTFDGTVEDDDSLNFTLSADNVNAIRWLSAGEDALAIGTAGGEWIPTSDGVVITPSDLTVRRQTTHGSAQIQPTRIDRVVLFVQKAKRKILEFGLEAVSLRYEAFDMTRLAQHITVGGITEIAYAEEPDSIVWAVRNDGQLLSMTFRRQEDVVGWARHIFGGNFGGNDPVAESVDTVPGNNGAGQIQNSEDRDEVWVIVKRTINSATVRYVEFLERDFETGDDLDDAYYSDSLITYDSTSATALSGLDHLEGEELTILADGAKVASKTVSSGSITLETAASTVQMGLPYTHVLKTLKVAAGNPQGTPLGRKKRLLGVTLAMLNSQTFSLGTSSSNTIDYDHREIGDPMDAPAPIFTGEKFVEFDGDWATDERMYLTSPDPVPFTLLALAPEYNLNPSI